MGCRQVTGGRDGVAIAWDLETSSAIGQLKGHRGHVTAVSAFTDDDVNVFISGAQVRFLAEDVY